MKTKFSLFILLFGFFVQSQEKPIIQKQEIIRIETELASDKMEGRSIFLNSFHVLIIFSLSLICF